MTPEQENAQQRYAALIAQAASYEQMRRAVLQEAAALARQYGLPHATNRNGGDVWRGERRREDKE